MTVFSSPLTPSDAVEGPLVPAEAALPLDEAARLLAEGESVLQDPAAEPGAAPEDSDPAGLELIALSLRSVTAPDVGLGPDSGALVSYSAMPGGSGDVAIVLAENSMSYTSAEGGACPCPMCSVRPSDPTETGAGGGGNVGAPGPAGTMNTLATYLNERNTGSTGNDFWDDFWGGGSDVSTPFFNLTASGTNAKNGVIRFNLNNSWYDADGIEGPNSATRRDAIRNALDVYEDILGIDFVEVTGTSTSQVDLAFGDEDVNRAFANFERASNGAISYAHINIGQNWSGVGTIGDYYFQTALHEIGHTLGLGHQGLYNAGSGSPTYNDATWANDTEQFTMMSYWAQSNYTPPGENTPSNVNLIGPQAVDWLALDRIYNPQGFGIDDGATTGNTTWGFNDSWGTSNARPVENLLNNAYSQMSTLLGSTAMTIADGGGIDTLDLSGFSNNTKIDLRITSGANIAPSFSNVAGRNGNLAIAPGTVIENAIGGAGSELIYGNTAANTLTGNAGNDTIYASSGADTLNGGTGADILYGEAGADSLNGNDDNDSLYGGADSDTLKGGGGADLLEGGTGVDLLDGEAGNDRLRLRIGDGSFANEGYVGGDGTDTLELRGAGTYDLRDATILTIEEIEFAGEGSDIDKTVYITGAQAIGLGAALIDGNNSSGSDDRLYIYLANSSTTSISLASWTFQEWDVSTTNTDTIYVVGDFDTVAESVTGSSRSDWIATYGGNDTVDGGAGTDTIYGGDGNDTLTGGAGADLVYGGNDNDTLTGGNGIDTLYGGAGNDRITSDGDGGLYYGDSGNDTMLSGLGNETMEGGDDIDTIDHRAFNANYTFDMGTGLTNFIGELYTGFEIVFMGDGNDSVTGSASGDTLYGGVGNDTLRGGGGADAVHGDAGDDTVYWETGEGNLDAHYGGSGTDLIHGGGTSFGSATFDLGAGTYTVSGFPVEVWQGFENYFNDGTGTETVIGSGSANRLETGSGANRLEGGGGADTLIGGAGNDTLLGGFMTDDIFGGDGDDLIQILDGEFYDNVDGGAGTDTLDHSAATYGGTTFDFNLGTMTGAGINGGTATVTGIEIYQDGSGANTIVSSGFSGLTLYGNDGNDTMIAVSGFDDMHGGAGIDLLDLSRGDFPYTFDTETGESVEYGAIESFSGFEQFLFGAANDTISTSTNVNQAETVWGGGGDDTIIDRSGTLDTAIDTYDGGAGTDTIVYTTNLFVGHSIDLSQNGLFFEGGLRDTLLNFENVRAENVAVGSIIGNTGANVLTAIGAFANAINGGDGNDTIDAGDGNDTIDGGTGADSMIGGAGDDTYTVDNVGDVVVEAAGEGTDTVLASVFFTLSGNVENLVQTGSANLTGVGNALDNVMTGNTGNNTMFGLDGNDTLDGGDGDDTLNGQTGDDMMIGGVGNDSLNGGGGTDTLDGGTGADTMVGGGGNDTYLVDNVSDAVVELAGQGIDTVITSLAHTLGSDVENLILTGAANRSGVGNAAANAITGNSGNNALYGLDGNDTLDGGDGNDNLFGQVGNDSLMGGAGNDTLNGGGGADTMAGGTGDDVYFVDSTLDVVIEAAGEGIDTVNTSLGYTLGDQVENLVLTGTANRTGVGNALDNAMTGNSGNNALYGLDGNDTLDGGAGNDNLFGQAGDDVLIGGAGNDTLNGGGGNDTLIGGIGTDSLIGGGGVDTFVFSSAAEIGLGATRDRVTDFTSGIDKIDLSGFAVALSFIGGGGFTGVAGQVRSVAGVLEGDLDGNFSVDFSLNLTNGAVVLFGDLIF